MHWFPSAAWSTTWRLACGRDTVAGAPIRPAPFLMPDGGGGHRLCVLSSGAAPNALVLQVPAFGEEMNFSRRAVAVAARAMATAGAAVLQLDLQGCGDSSGDTALANWADWQADLVRAAAWLRQQHPGLPLWLWGQRAGAVLACSALGADLCADHLLFWNPMASGADLTRHLLRLHAAGALAQGLKGGTAMAEARAAWQAGQTVTVAGYPIPADLVLACAEAVVAPPTGHRTGRLVWLDVSPQPRTDPLPAQLPLLQAWRSTGWTTEHACLEGAPFWQGPETTEAPALTARSIAALARA